MFSCTLCDSFYNYYFERISVTENMFYVDYLVCDSPLVTIL